MHAFTFPTIDGVRLKDLAEALSVGLLEGSCGLYVIYCYLKAPLDLKRYSLRLVLALIPLFVFGLVLDMLPFHSLEQPGEMVAMSILLAFMHLTYCQHVPAASGDTD